MDSTKEFAVGDVVRFRYYAQGERPPAGSFRVTAIDGERVNIKRLADGDVILSVPVAMLRTVGDAGSADLRLLSDAAVTLIAAADEGSASLFVACLLAGIVPTILALLFVAPFLAALSGVAQS